jgi:hypothetical protein
VGYRILYASELERVPRGEGDTRTVAGISGARLFIRGAPPERAGAELYPDVP